MEQLLIAKGLPTRAAAITAEVAADNAADNSAIRVARRNAEGITAMLLELVGTTGASEAKRIRGGISSDLAGETSPSVPTQSGNGERLRHYGTSSPILDPAVISHRRKATSRARSHTHTCPLAWANGNGASSAPLPIPATTNGCRRRWAKGGFAGPHLHGRIGGYHPDAGCTAACKRESRLAQSLRLPAGLLADESTEGGRSKAGNGAFGLAL